MRLGAVFDDPEIVLLRDRHDLIHVSWLTAKMNWNNADRRFRDLSFDQTRVDIEGIFLGIAKNNTTSRLRDRLRSCDPRMRGGNYFIPGLQPQPLHYSGKCLRATGARNIMRYC